MLFDLCGIGNLNTLRLNIKGILEVDNASYSDVQSNMVSSVVSQYQRLRGFLPSYCKRNHRQGYLEDGVIPIMERMVSKRSFSSGCSVPGASSRIVLICSTWSIRLSLIFSIIFLRIFFCAYCSLMEKVEKIGALARTIIRRKSFILEAS